MLTKKPSALVYNWSKLGVFNMRTSLYDIEHLWDDIVVYSLPLTNNLMEDYARYKPDLIVSFEEDLKFKDSNLKNRYLYFDNLLWQPTDIANRILQKSIDANCNNPYPKISVFTPTYKTGERIYRTYESLKNQTYDNWEWVVVDDSPDLETWDMITEIAEKDYRVKPHRIYPLSGGNIGLAKNRAAMLCDGDWLIELDHDDCLVSTCLETSNDAISKFPDAGFLYTDCSEIYEDGEPKFYDHDWTGNFYARHDNYFDFGYAGHSWTTVDGVDRLAHWYPDVNPLTIRFNISMPNHARMWERNVYHRIAGHNKLTPVADDLEILIRTFLETRMIHVKKVLYLQYNNNNSTVDNNATDINRRARLIRDHYDLRIHQRIEELGFFDWNWDEINKHSQKFQNNVPIRKYYKQEQVMNYIYE